MQRPSLRLKWFSRNTAIEAVISTERVTDEPRPRLLADRRPTRIAEQHARHRAASWRWPD